MTDMTWLLPAWIIIAPAIAFVAMSGMGATSTMNRLTTTAEASLGMSRPYFTSLSGWRYRHLTSELMPSSVRFSCVSRR